MGQLSGPFALSYEGYTGWFRHNSTTELYSYSPKSIFPELNDLIDRRNGAQEGKRSGR